MLSNTRAEFIKHWPITKQDMPGYQDRFVAFVNHLGFVAAYSGNVAQRGVRFQEWIAARKDDFTKAHPDLVVADRIDGYPTIVCQDAFTDYIVSGDWLE